MKKYTYTQNICTIPEGSLLIHNGRICIAIKTHEWDNPSVGDFVKASLSAGVTEVEIATRYDRFTSAVDLIDETLLEHLDGKNISTEVLTVSFNVTVEKEIA